MLFVRKNDDLCQLTVFYDTGSGANFPGFGVSLDLHQKISCYV